MEAVKNSCIRYVQVRAKHGGKRQKNGSKCKMAKKGKGRASVHKWLVI